jgi:hypothetical protein
MNILRENVQNLVDDKNNNNLVINEEYFFDFQAKLKEFELGLKKFSQKSMVNNKLYSFSR